MIYPVRNVSAASRNDRYATGRLYVLGECFCDLRESYAVVCRRELDHQGNLDALLHRDTPNSHTPLTSRKPTAKSAGRKV